MYTITNYRTIKKMAQEVENPRKYGDGTLCFTYSVTGSSKEYDGSITMTNFCLKEDLTMKDFLNQWKDYLCQVYEHDIDQFLGITAHFGPEAYKVDECPRCIKVREATKQRGGKYLASAKKVSIYDNKIVYVPDIDDPNPDQPQIVLKKKRAVQ